MTTGMKQLMADVPRKRRPEYFCWVGMRQRCNNDKNPGWINYGGRGIRVCSRWDSFENFIADMGPRPSPRHGVERINNDGDYAPGNCRWATNDEQQENKRTNVYVTLDGERTILAEAARRLGVPIVSFWRWLKRFGEQEAVRLSRLDRRERIAHIRRIGVSR